MITGTLPVLIREELDFNTKEMKELAGMRYDQFTREQCEIFEIIIYAFQTMIPKLVFIDGRGGCGKSWVLDRVLAKVRSMEPGGCVALAMATTGIAANLLMLGRTFHS